MRQFGDTKHRKVLRKSKKQWITVGLTSAALGITGLVHNAELVNAQESVAAQNQETTKSQLSLEELVNSFVTYSAESTLDQNDLLSKVSEKASQLGLDAEQAVASVKAQIKTSESDQELNDANTESVGSQETNQENEKEPETPVEAGAVSDQDFEENEDVSAQKVEGKEAEVEVSDEAPQTETEKDSETEGEVKINRAVLSASSPAAPSVQTFSTQANQVTDADLDAYLGSNTHADGTPMENRQVDIVLDQRTVRDSLESKVRDFRLDAYNRNLPFQYEWYDARYANNSTARTLQQAARDAGYLTGEEYANAISWSDRLEDYSIQRATELLTTGYHSGHNSHERPDLKTRDHRYINETGSINHSAPENIHAAGDQNLDQAFYAWTEREVNNLRSADGAMVYGGQAETTAHIHSILNPVYTSFGGASVRLANGDTGPGRGNPEQAHVLIVTRRDNVNNYGHVATADPRVGTYRVDVLTKAGSPTLPGEADLSQPTTPTQPTEEVIEHDIIYRFDQSLPVDGNRVIREGRDGLRVDGEVTNHPVTEIVAVGPTSTPIVQGEAERQFDPNLPVDSVRTQEGRDGYQLVNPLDGTVVKVEPAQNTVITHGPTQKEVDFETEYRVNFDLELGQTNIAQVGQVGLINYNPLTDEAVETVREVQNQIVEVGVEQRDVPFDTVRRPVVGLDEERVIQEGSTGLAYFDQEGNRYEERSIAPVNQIIEYPAIEREVPFETERVAVVGLDEERVAQAGQAGIAYFDEDGNQLDVEENTALVNEIVEYPAIERDVPFETERVAVVGLEEERVAQAGQAGVAYFDEDGNQLDVEENTAPVNQIVEYPAIERVIEFEVERVANKDLEPGQEQVVQEGKNGLAFYDEEGNVLDVPENVEPINQIVEYGVKEDEPQSSPADPTSPKPTDQETSTDESDADLKAGSQSEQVTESVTEPTAQPVSQPLANPTQKADQLAAAKDQATQAVAGLTSLSREERRQIVAAIDSTDDLGKVEELVKAADALNTSRSQSGSSQAEESKASDKSGQTLPDTATSAWVLGLAGITTLVSGLGIKKKFKN